MTSNLSKSRRRSPRPVASPLLRAAAAARAALEALEPRQLMSTWYIATNGNNNGAGTLAAPFASLEKALDVAQANDTIILRGGTYAGGTEVDKSNITITGYGSEVAKIASPLNNANIFNGLSFAANVHHVTVKNLDISGGYYYAMKTETTRDYDNPAGSYVGASDLLFENVKFHDSGMHVIKLSPDCDRITFKSCEIFNAGMRDPTDGQGMDAVNVDDMVMVDCYVHDVTQNGIFVKGGSQRCIIERCRVDKVGFSGILLGQATDPEVFDPNQNPGRFEALNCVARNNIVTNAQYSGISSWSGKGNKIINNTMANVAIKGQGAVFLSVNGEGTKGQDLTIVNNIITMSGDEPALNILEDAFTGTPVFNHNRVYRTINAGVWILDQRDAGWQGDLADWAADKGGVGNSEGNPLLTSDFHLSQNSPAINAGTAVAGVTNDFDGEARPQGGAPDIGADEVSTLNANLSGGVLTIAGAAGVDAISVSLNGAKTGVVVTVNGASKTFTLSQVVWINIDSGDGNDVILIGDGVERTYAYAGAGNDKIVDGNGSNTLGGAAGKDTLYGGTGTDRINGHGSNDRLFGEAGGDRLYGGDGADMMDGGSSNDRFFGGIGDDTLFGQGGNDRFYQKDNTLTVIYGGTGDDWADVDKTDQLFSVEVLYT